jgi:hypothetical protein
MRNGLALYQTIVMKRIISGIKLVYIGFAVRPEISLAKKATGDIYG